MSFDCIQSALASNVLNQTFHQLHLRKSFKDLYALKVQYFLPTRGQGKPTVCKWSGRWYPSAKYYLQSELHQEP